MKVIDKKKLIMHYNYSLSVKCGTNWRRVVSLWIPEFVLGFSSTARLWFAFELQITRLQLVATDAAIFILIQAFKKLARVFIRKRQGFLQLIFADLTITVCIILIEVARESHLKGRF